MGASRWVLAAVLVCSLSGRAVASEPEDDAGPGMDLLGPMVGIVSISLTAAGGVFAIGNLSYLPRDYRAPGVWRVGGFITGAVNMTLGALLLYGYYREPASERHAFSFGITWAQLTFGVVATGAAIWNSTKPPWSEEPEVAVAPVVMVDSRGGPAPGLVVSVVGW